MLKDGEDPLTVSNKEWQKRLTDEQYYVTREKGTERVGSNLLLSHTILIVRRIVLLLITQYLPNEVTSTSILALLWRICTQQGERYLPLCLLWGIIIQVCFILHRSCKIINLNSMFLFIKVSN